MLQADKRRASTRSFFPQGLKQHWGVLLEQDTLNGMMHLGLASNAGLEKAMKIWAFLSQRKHPELVEPVKVRIYQWNRQLQRKSRSKPDFPNTTLEMHFKLEGGQIKFMDADINTKLEW